MQAEVLLSVFFRASSGGCRRRRRTSCSVSGRSNGRNGRVAGWPKIAEVKKTRVAALSSSKEGEIWQWQHRGRASLLYLNGNTTVIPTD
jgi:hypothetical protein